MPSSDHCNTGTNLLLRISLLTGYNGVHFDSIIGLKNVKKGDRILLSLSCKEEPMFSEEEFDGQFMAEMLSPMLNISLLPIFFQLKNLKDKFQVKML